jgi:hypothetical protein
MSATWSISKVECLPSVNGNPKVIFKVFYEVRKAPGKKPWPSVIALNMEKVGSDFIPFENVKQENIVQWVKDVLLTFRADFIDDIEGCLSDEDETIEMTIAS